MSPKLQGRPWISHGTMPEYAYSRSGFWANSSHSFKFEKLCLARMRKGVTAKIELITSQWIVPQEKQLPSCRRVKSITNSTDKHAWAVTRQTEIEHTRSEVAISVRPHSGVAGAIASMRPRSIDRGIINGWAYEFWLGQLQWGRDQVITELTTTTTYYHGTSSLQWGRDQVITELAGAQLFYCQ
jgi:hypothetical protein